MQPLSNEEQQIIAECILPEKNIEKFVNILQGRDPNSVLSYDQSNWPLLFIATWFNFKEGVNHLLSNGANSNFCTKDGTNALLIATTNSNNMVAKILLKHGADINKQDKEGLTPLMSACDVGNIELVDFFINNKAKVLIKDKMGNSCLEYAKNKGHENILSLIEKKLYSNTFKSGNQKKVCI